MKELVYKVKIQVAGQEIKYKLRFCNATGDGRMSFEMLEPVKQTNKRFFWHSMVAPKIQPVAQMLLFEVENGMRSEKYWKPVPRS